MFPKGFKLPQGMNVAQAQNAMQATGECVSLVDALLKDEELGGLVKEYILARFALYPILSGNLK